MKSSKQIAMLLAAVAMTACNTDLKITDPNNPTTARAISNAGDVQALIGGTIQSWYVQSQETEPSEAFATMANVFTSSYGNFGMRFNSNVPRIAYNNTASSGDAVVANNPWSWNYATLGAANDGLNAITRGIKIVDDTGGDATGEYTAIAHFTQGTALGNIALIFDKGFIIDDKTPVPPPATFSPYAAVSTAALAKMDLAIAEATGQTWTIPSQYTTAINMTAPKFAQLANTIAAQILAYTPRTAAETQAVDWARVRSYAEKGIQYDFSPIGDYNNWWSDATTYKDSPSWMRVDMRVIHEMAPGQPSVLPSCTALPAGTSPDARFTTDITYEPSIPFSPARGCYHFSSYGHTRYFAYGVDASTTQIGPVPMILQAENDLLIAEADARLGTNLDEAATLINKTRVGRGNLPPVSAATGAAGLLAAIQYEQDVELLASGANIQYYDRRRIDGLQPQTPLELPVPAKELQTDGLAVYTFGGPNNPTH